MPYARRPRGWKSRRRRTTKRTLSRKNIRKRTGARSQSKQIASLARSVSKLNRNQTERVVTHWQRNSLPCQTVLTDGKAYMCPMPYNAMDPLDRYNPGSGITTKWTDSLALAAQPFFTKKLLFGYSDAALGTGVVEHTGGLIQYQITSDEPSFSRVTLALVRPKKAQADQITIDKSLITGTVPYGPANDYFVKGVDYECHNAQGGSGAANTYFGTVINRKYWDVLFSRDLAFGHVGATNQTSNVNPANTNPLNNALIATGTIKLPAAGRIVSTSGPYLGGGTPAIGDSQCALQLGALDGENHKNCFLVLIQNGVSADSENINLGLSVSDYYKCSI